MYKKKIAVVFGTRPEAIKMVPVINELKKKQELFDTLVIVSAQHREMLDQVLSVFKIKPDYDLDIMKDNQSLSDITTGVLNGIEEIFRKEKPDMVLVHGDTTTSFAASLAAYYQKIAIGHVEAGLRTKDIYSPFPEEGNRVLIDAISNLYFVPTEDTKYNLISEGKDGQKIVVTGNTVIDMVFLTKCLDVQHEVLELMNSKPEQKWILLTMHRRENYGEPMSNVFKAITSLINKYPNLEVLMPVHLSPMVQSLVREEFTGHNRIHLVKPLEVDVFHRIIEKSTIILTDSGGLQEEAPALNVPVLVLRNKTERPEGVTAGTLKVIGTDKNAVIREVSRLIENKEEYDKMSQAKNPYGDGTASKKIIEVIYNYFIRNRRKS